ncbi:unnamed protein product [Linum tenue]|uniref:Maturase K n=1 Tax=Linum tenue TaxID=586396 RepID=A0AAV0IPD6_9ROSI|nr:unnamed protein product [Linum tenue]
MLFTDCRRKLSGYFDDIFIYHRAFIGEGPLKSLKSLLRTHCT